MMIAVRRRTNVPVDFDSKRRNLPTIERRSRTRRAIARFRYTLPVVLILPFMTGCAGMDRTDQRIVSGAAIGGIFGGPIGAGVGAGVGYAVDRYESKR
jgi:hypothetical protein